MPRLVWVLFAFAIVLLTGDRIRRWRESRRAVVTWRDYRKDTVNGLLWTWTWHYMLPESADNEDIERFAHALVPLCPNCEANLDIRVEELTCPNGHTRKSLRRGYDYDPYQRYAERIAAEIVRRVRSDEYKRALNRR